MNLETSSTLTSGRDTPTGHEDLVELLTLIAGNLGAAAKIIYPDRFHRPFDNLHHQIFRLFQKRPGDPGYNPQKAIAAPRGLGKTSIINLLVPTVRMMLQDVNYILQVGASATNAQAQSENLKHALTGSEVVQQLYPDLKTNNWSKEEWVVEMAGHKVKIHPRGAGQEVRGLLFGNSRPDLILIDDLEKVELQRSPEQREKLKKWFYGDLLNTVDRGSDSWEIILIGTVQHEDSLLENLLSSDDWDTLRLELCDDQFRSHAPNFMDDEAVYSLYKKYKNDREVDVFYREYRNIPRPVGKDAAFQPSYFRYYSEKDKELSFSNEVENIVLVDPSRTTNMSSAPSGIIGVGLNLSAENHGIFVRRCKKGRWHPEELYLRLEQMIRELNADVLGVEVTGLHEYILHPLKNYLARKGIMIPIMELHARGGQHEDGKTARVRSLVDYYREGLVYHNPDETDPLESQLMAFPRSRDWSLMDPLGYIPQILEKGERYMSAMPTVMDEQIESKREVEREYQVLENAPMETLDKFRRFL